MRTELFRGAGYYDSNYFRIYVDTEDSFLDVTQVSEIGAAISLHEYIHYLQDITTTNGLFNIASEVDYVKLLNGKIRDTDAFQVPYEPTSEDGNVYVNLNVH